MKVLVVEDELVTRRLLEAYLSEWGYHVSIACDGLEALDLLSSPNSPRLVISDWMMPHVNGLELCRKIRQKDLFEYVYFIILTAKGRKEDVIEALEAGADDHVVKPFDAEELKYRVKIGKRILDLENRILEMARTDFLTGVLNRGAFVARLEQEMQRTVREHVALSLILADIDSFKRVNDEYGHNAGDIVLQAFAKELSTSLRPYDFVGRYGGEEFLVSLVGANTSQAKLVAERMRERIEGMRVQLPGVSKPVQITASFGVASQIVTKRETLLSITGRADHAMYQAKRKGRNRVCSTADINETPFESNENLFAVNQPLTVE
jgi:two-component system chemotaxis response regulator CheY